jgi:hypothetical protein
MMVDIFSVINFRVQKNKTGFIFTNRKSLFFFREKQGFFRFFPPTAFYWFKKGIKKAWYFLSIPLSEVFA